jgi:histidinol-phosphate aminotransferase
MLAWVRSELQELSAYHLQAMDPHQIKLDANESPLDLPDHLKAKLQAVVGAIPAHRYPDGVYRDLKQAVADYSRVPLGWVSLGNGSDELIRSILIVAGVGQGEIVVAEPTFSMYGILAQSLGIRVNKIARHPDWSIDLEQAQGVMAQTNRGVLFVVHPNSPTGNLLTAGEISWLESVPESWLVVIDEAYYEFAQTSLVHKLPEHPNWIILRTFSKALRLAGYRVGYALAQPETIAYLEKVRLPYNLPVLSAQAALFALENHPELLADIPATIERREKIYAELQQLGLQVWPSRANFLYFRTGINASMDQLVLAKMAEAGILLRYTGGGLRLTIGTAAEMAQCMENLRAVLQALNL